MSNVSKKNTKKLRKQNRLDRLETIEKWLGTQPKTFEFAVSKSEPLEFIRNRVELKELDDNKFERFHAISFVSELVELREG